VVVISVALPSRGRPAGLADAVNSLYLKADCPKRVEVIIRVDCDDKSSSHVLSALKQRWPQTVVLMGPRLDGYLSFHHYVNHCFAVAAGREVLLFNDDTVMSSPSWDSHLDEAPMGPYGPELRYIIPWDDTRHGAYPCFPIISKKLWSISGGFRSPACDSWCLEVFKEDLEMDVQQFKIRIKHRRPDLPQGFQSDDTFRGAEAVRKQIHEEFYGPAGMALRTAAAERVRDYLEQAEA
jgi:hypothetical protein